MICSTFMDWFAHSMRFFPRSASSMFLISQFTAAVDMLSPSMARGMPQKFKFDYQEQVALATDSAAEMQRGPCSSALIFSDYTSLGNQSGYPISRFRLRPSDTAA
jgi:hypothetical protein